MGGFKDNVVSRFKTIYPQDYGKQVMRRNGKKPSKPKTQKIYVEN